VPLEVDDRRHDAVVHVRDRCRRERLGPHDDNIGIDRQIKGGQAVPPDLIDAYNAEVGNAPVSVSGDGQGESVDYDSQQVDDLQAEADRRGIEVEGTGADGNVLKKDLVAALKADDAA
jgi:hypothetical protein